MKKVTLDDIVGFDRYQAMREEFRRRIIEVKRHRRISLGDRITLVFENRDTVLFQIQEMCHVERISDIDRVREEVEVYNQLLPGENELSATLLIEITDPSRIASDLHALVGIDECVRMCVDGTPYRATFAPGQSTEEKLSAVQYIRFPLSVEATAAIVDCDASIDLEIDHPRYHASARLTSEQRASLARDLAA
jgi:hypothetical protein